MRSDFEQLLWLYSMGVEDVATRKPQNYSNVQLVKKINDSAYQDGRLLKKSEKNHDLDRENFLNEVYKKDINAIKSCLLYTSAAADE